MYYTIINTILKTTILNSHLNHPRQKFFEFSPPLRRMGMVKHLFEVIEL